MTVAGFASAAYGATSLAPSVVPLLEAAGVDAALALTLSTVLLTLLIAYLSLVLGELVPKRLAIQRNAQFAYAVAPVLSGFATLMRPIIWLLSMSTNALVRLLGGDPHKTGEELTDDEVRDIVASHEGLPEDERKILDDVLSLRGRQVSEVMRPRPEVSGLDVTSTIEQAVARVRDLPFSRYPVSGGSIDDIAGFVHVRDLFEAVAARPGAPVDQLVRPMPYVPSTARVLPTLTRMRADGHHIAVVVDEYGGTDGIVTLEDLVEEVVGEIVDEYDPAALPASDNDIVDGRLNLLEVEEATGVRLPRGASDTVAGVVTEHLGRLARVGDAVDVGGVTLEVTAMDRRRVAEVRVTRGAAGES